MPSIHPSIHPSIPVESNIGDDGPIITGLEKIISNIGDIEKIFDENEYYSILQITKEIVNSVLTLSRTLKKYYLLPFL